MKIILKNETNMAAYSNIPEGDNKLALKFDKSNNIWSSNKIGGIHYIITTQFTNKEFTEIEIRISHQPHGDGDFTLCLNIINGIKLDNEWVSDDESYSYYSKSTNDFLINKFKESEKIYIYGLKK